MKGLQALSRRDVEKRPKRSQDLDEQWSEYRPLVFLAAIRLVKKFGGEKEDFLGWCFLRFNVAVSSYDPETNVPFENWYLMFLEENYYQEVWSRELEVRAQRRSKLRPKANVDTTYLFETGLYDPLRDPSIDVGLALREVTPRYRALLLEWIGGRPMKDIAVDNRLSTQRVQQLIAKALKQLKRRLEDYR